VALTIGIVGLPNAGKSTLFNALTKNDVLAANYPFATIEPNVGVVGVPDDRLPRLAEVFGSARILPATVEFVDIAGIVRGASEGEGLGNKFLSHIRESAAICQVTRVFRDEDVTHVDGEVNPANDISTIQTEMILADLQTVEKAIPRLEKEARGKKDLLPVVAAATTGARALLPFASFSRRGIALSTVCRSARIISVWMVEMSLAGFTSPSTCVTSSSRKTRVTWQIAADSRMCERNLLPRPSPSDAPLTMPAMSTNSTVAGITFAEENSSASTPSRGSGTPTTPTLGSIVANG